MTLPQTRIPFVDLRAQYATIAPEINAAIAQVLQRCDFVLGADVQALEEEFAAYCGARYAVGVDSGLSALELGIRALGIGPGDEVITPANSFIASASSISFTGAMPILVDVDPATYNIDPALVRRAITPRTKAIMAVHLYGQPAELATLRALADEAGVALIEDAAQAHGARYRGQPVGAFGAFGAFSFYPGKNLGAYGEAGIVVTNDQGLADEVRILRNCGQREKYHHVRLSFNRRLDTLQAAVVRVKLRYLDSWNAARREHAAQYAALLGSSPTIVLPYAAPAVEHVYHLYVVQVANRAAVQRALEESGISTAIHYPIPVHRQEAYAHLHLAEGSFPVTEGLAPRILSLPMYAELPAAAISHIAHTLQGAV